MVFYPSTSVQACIWKAVEVTVIEVKEMAADSFAGHQTVAGLSVFKLCMRDRQVLSAEAARNPMRCSAEQARSAMLFCAVRDPSTAAP